MTSPSATAVGAVELSPRRRWMALAALALPVLLISMDATILGFAVPKLTESLRPSSSELLWIVDVYSFVLAGLLVTMGTLGDRIGRRRLLVIGSIGFAVASVLSAWAPNSLALIGARAALGLSGATLLPSTLSLIRNIFIDPIERTKAIAIWATSFSVGAALGPLVGGFLLDHFWWGSVFLVGVPITVATVVAMPILVPESLDPNPGRFDAVSSVLSIATMLLAVAGIKRIAESGLDAVAVGAVVVGVALGVVFLRRQRRVESPMIDVALFRVPRFSAAIGGNLMACFGFGSSMFFVTQYLQLVAGMSAIRAGVQLLPAVAASIVMTLVAPSLAKRFGSFPVIVTGLGLGALGFAVLSRLGGDAGVGVVTAAMVIINGGLAPAMAVSVDGIIASVPPEKAGAGASVSETANELGIALGTALLGSIATAIYRSHIAEAIAPLGHGGEAARETLGGAHVVAAQLPDTQAEPLLAAASSAFGDGVSVAATIAAVLGVAVATSVGVVVARTREGRVVTPTRP